jgi:hypothetical protein
MNHRTAFNILLLCPPLLVCAARIASAQGGLVCGDPTDQGCRPQYEAFAPHDLPFLTGRAVLGTGTRHESFEFYALMLESVKAEATTARGGCEFVSERKRRAAQKLFPHNKVFASRNLCRGHVVSYEGVVNDFNFMAVYGGATEEEAGRLLAQAKRRYPGVNLRKLKVILDFADE